MNYGKGTSAEEDSQAGVVTLLHNIIIGGDEQTRAWFAQYLKCMQQKVCDSVTFVSVHCNFFVHCTCVLVPFILIVSCW